MNCVTIKQIWGIGKLIPSVLCKQYNCNMLSNNSKVDIFLFFQVRDGYWYKSDLLAKLCGNKIPAAIISTGSRMMLTYKTHNQSPDHKGFTAQYEAVCGGDIDMETGQLESPNFPEDYQPNKECIYGGLKCQKISR